MENIEELVVQSIEVDDDVDLTEAFSGRKRLRRPELWKRNIQKRCRAEGKPYINSKNQLVPERTMGEDCHCRKRCFAKLTEEEKEQIFKAFYQLANKEKQDMYLRGLITREPVKRKRPRTGHGHKRSTSFRYILRVEDKTVEVCKQAIVSIHGITRSRLDRILSLSLKYLTGPPDLRGHHNNRPRKIDDLILHQIHTHICSFFQTQGKNKKSFVEDIDARRMYDSYLKKYENVTEKGTVKYSYFYRFLVNNFNYKAHRVGRSRRKNRNNEFSSPTEVIEIDDDCSNTSSQNEKENHDEFRTDSENNEEMDDPHENAKINEEKCFQREMHEKLHMTIYTVSLSNKPTITIVEDELMVEEEEEENFPDTE